jgi:hypothetical protein
MPDLLGIDEKHGTNSLFRVMVQISWLENKQESFPEAMGVFTPYSLDLVSAPDKSSCRNSLNWALDWNFK